MNTSQSQSIASTLERAQKLIQAQQFEAAFTALQELSQTQPQEPEMLYMLAVCQRYLQQYDAALETLATLKALQPEHGRAHQEEGHTYLALHNNEAALAAFERACFYNPALVASFRARLKLLAAKGDTAQTRLVQQQLDALLALAKPLIAVVDLISMGRLLRAEELCRQYLQKVPRDVEAMRLLADIGLRLGILEDAEFLLKSAHLLAPENLRVQIDYIQALRKRQRHGEALEQSEKLLLKEPSNPQFQSIFAVQCMQSGQFEKALTTFNNILETLPNDPVTLMSKGHALKTMGDSASAIASYQRAIAVYPSHGEAYFSLANLKTYRFSDQEIEAMKSLQQDSNLSFMDRVNINFALGKALEDRQEFPQSFNAYAQGNQLKKSQSRYSAEQSSEETDLQKQYLTTELFRQKQAAGHNSSDPIFIVGLPRAGSTLIEQILSSHSQVDGTLELPNVLSLSQRLRRHVVNGKKPGYPEVLNLLNDNELTAFGEEFIEDTRPHRQGAPFFIDKMPNNFRHIGLIKLMLPNAKIIDARRNALDCCFSGFKQLFAEGQEFSYALEDIGQYYKDYTSLMSHWDEVLPGFVLRVMNEKVISDLEGEVRRMLAFCGLPFEQSCLEFHTTERNVRTPSSEQVRRPVNRAGVGQWQKYEQHLNPLKQALGPDLVKLSMELSIELSTPATHTDRDHAL